MNSEPSTMNHQLMYVTLDLRRGLFVAEATGATILTSYASDLMGQVRKRGITVWCFEELYPNLLLPDTSSKLIGHGKTLKWLRTLGKNITFLVFKPSNKVRELIEKKGWKLQSPDPDLCRKLEDKITFNELAAKYEIQVPRFQVLLWDAKKIPEYHKKFGNSFMVQGRIGHAGSSTWVVQNGKVSGPEERGGIKHGMRMKISEKIEGQTYTLNGFVSPQGKLVISPLFLQLMHVPEWNTYEMGTVGISPIHGSELMIQSLKEILLKLSPLFKKEGYSGFFGLDLIWNGKQWYLIECNPRFTASVSLQCLIDLSNKRKPLLTYHAEGTEPSEHRFDFQCLTLCFGHLILRNTKDRPWKIPRTLKSGIYQCEAKKWKFKKRTSDGLLLQENELLLILAKKSGSSVEPGSDYATIIFKDSAHHENGIIHDRFFDFYDRVVMKYFIRPKGFWIDRYGKTQSTVSMFGKPSAKTLQTQVSAHEVITLLGEHGDYFLAERADGTRGWITKKEKILQTTKEDFVLPGKNSLSAEAFFEHWTGKPYLRGGNTEQGIDCSAFVQRYFWEVKGILLPKHTQDQKAILKKEVSREEVQDDDLVFLHSKAKKIPHVGMIRNGKIWHASLETGVILQDLEEISKKYEIESFRRLNSTISLIFRNKHRVD